MIGFAEYIKSCEDYLYFLNEIIFNELIHIDFSYKKIVNLRLKIVDWKSIQVIGMEFIMRKLK